MPPAEPAKPAAEPIPLKVVYEDDDIIVIDKPRNLVVHPAAGHWTGTLVNALIAHCGDSLSGIGGERRPGIVHRLDKDTTGLMVVAKNDRAHRALAAQFADHGKSDEAFERGYLALVWGAPERPHGTIDKPLDRDTRARDRMAVREGGREAITHWQVLERYQGGKPAKMTAKGAKPEAAGGEPPALPAGNRPDPPDSGPFGLDRPPFAGRRDLRGRIPHQNGAFAAGGPGRAGEPLADRRFMPIYCRSNIPAAANSCGSNRNCRMTSPVCVQRWPAVGPRPARKRQAISKDLPVSRVFTVT